VLVGIIIILSIGFSISYITLYIQHQELQQYYDWAVELSKIPVEHREDILKEIGKQLII